MRRERGFTLIELLIVIAIIAIIAALSAMSYIHAVDRARQKRTMNDMRSIAAAWEARAGDTHSYTAAGFAFPATPMTYDDLERALTPTYTRTIPRTDGWRREYEFGVTGETTYALRSSGKDGVFESSPYTEGGTSNIDCDIIYSDGAFITYPEGVQSQ
jgi:type II secretion system protein G